MVETDPLAYWSKAKASKKKSDTIRALSSHVHI
jgi:hypothetical protein